MTRESAIATCIKEVNDHQAALFGVSYDKKYEIMIDLYGIVKELSSNFIHTMEDVNKFRSVARQISLMSQHLLPS